MTTLVRSIAFTGAGALGMAALSVVSPAAAASVAGCGDEPAGGSLTRTGDVCQLDFTTPGAYAWTVPSGLTGLYAVLVGGGGGAFANGSDSGYSGSGGEVVYSDLTLAQAGAAVSVTVGFAGVTGASAPTAGSSSSVTVAVPAIAATALGGIAGGFFTPSYCVADGNFSTYVGNGNGAGGDQAGPGGDDCATSASPGVRPSADADSNALAALPIFSSLTTEFGAGGRVLVSPQTLPAAPSLVGTGVGASALYVAPSTVPLADAAGGSGRVIFRYAATDSGLAATGSTAEVLPAAGFAAGLGLIGAMMLAFSRRRRVTSSAANR